MCHTVAHEGWCVPTTASSSFAPTSTLNTPRANALKPASFKSVINAKSFPTASGSSIESMNGAPRLAVLAVVATLVALATGSNQHTCPAFDTACHDKAAAATGEPEGIRCL